MTESPFPSVRRALAVVENDALPLDLRTAHAMAQAVTLANEHTALMLAQAERAALSALEVAVGGACYPDGVRQEAGKLAESIRRHVLTIDAIRSMGRR